MFQEDYDKLSRGDKELFSETINDLLYQCFIVRKSYDRKNHMFRADPDYLFIERHYSMFEDYLTYMDMQLSKSDEDGVIFLSSGAERNHLRVDTVTTLLIYAIRSYYEGQIAKAPEETEVLMTYGALSSFLQETGLSNLTKRLSSSVIAASLRSLDSFNIIAKANGNYGDPSYSFFVLPTIRYVISSEKMNALYDFLTKGGENGNPDVFTKPEVTVPLSDEAQKAHDSFQDAIAGASAPAETAPAAPEKPADPLQTVDVPVEETPSADKEGDNH
jgi:hypothetical protein